MKYFLLTLILLSSIQVLACQDWSNSYKGESGQITDFTQKGCETLTIHEAGKSGEWSKTFILDGKWHSFGAPVLVAGRTAYEYSVYFTYNYMTISLGGRDFSDDYSPSFTIKSVFSFSLNFSNRIRRELVDYNNRTSSVDSREEETLFEIPKK